MNDPRTMSSKITQFRTVKQVLASLSKEAASHRRHADKLDQFRKLLTSVSKQHQRLLVEWYEEEDA